MAAARREPVALAGPFRDARLTALLGSAPLRGIPMNGRLGREGGRPACWSCAPGTRRSTPRCAGWPGCWDTGWSA